MITMRVASLATLHKMVIVMPHLVGIAVPNRIWWTMWRQTMALMSCRTAPSITTLFRTMRLLASVTRTTLWQVNRKYLPSITLQWRPRWTNRSQRCRTLAYMLKDSFKRLLRMYPKPTMERIRMKMTKKKLQQKWIRWLPFVQCKRSSTTWWVSIASFRFTEFFRGWLLTLIFVC